MCQHIILLSQNAIPGSRTCFQKLEAMHRTGHSSHKFGFKEQFTVMAIIQLTARRSMRTICTPYPR